MPTISSFANPHKGLGNVISKFAFQLGHTDVGNSSALHRLKVLGEEMFTLLNDHVHTKNGLLLGVSRKEVLAYQHMTGMTMRNWMKSRMTFKDSS